MKDLMRGEGAIRTAKGAFPEDDTGNQKCIIDKVVVITRKMKREILR